ncbi:glycine betaine ABC transporter substrate-binding protein [Stackebrandtia soli]|uniref:glycine betaine ABC transporter substrate-binding protein n=1 Tax=Stackebrandtia soli TaxID=1892856 RepID=UPI0039EA4055
MRFARALAAGIASLALAACGLQPASQYIPEVKPGPELERFDSLDGARVVTTGKDFTEQLILGKMLSLVLSAAGAEVVDNTNTKGSTNARESLLRGDADVMWEYTGTGWVVYLGHTDGDRGPDGEPVDLADKAAVLAALSAQDLEQNQLVWGTKPAPFNNTYAIAVTEEAAAEHDLKNLSDIASLPPDEQTFCLENEFAARGDGWPGMKEAYGLDIPAGQVSIMDAGIVYGEIGTTCVFGEVFGTDGRIPANNLVTLVDDEMYFPLYEPVVVVREPIAKRYPQIIEMFDELGQQLDTDTMRELNGRVDVYGENPTAVAQDWLVQVGFLAPER